MSIELVFFKFWYLAWIWGEFLGLMNFSFQIYWHTTAPNSRPWRFVPPPLPWYKHSINYLTSWYILWLIWLQKQNEKTLLRREKGNTFCKLIWHWGALIQLWWFWNYSSSFTWKTLKYLLHTKKESQKLMKFPYYYSVNGIRGHAV